MVNRFKFELGDILKSSTIDFAGKVRRRDPWLGGVNFYKLQNKHGRQFIDIEKNLTKAYTEK